MNKKTIYSIVGGVVGLGLIVALALSIANEQEVDDSIGFRPVEVTGAPLPLFDPTAADPTVGLEAPTAVGTDWNDVETTIQADGRSKIVMFLAHWCSHCQAEVPVVQAWVDGGNLPDNVDLYSVTTSTDRLRPNWPPQDWLEEEGWTAPVIMDDQIGTVAGSFGMSGTPFYVVLDGENRVIRRVSGEIGIAGLDALAAEAAAAS
ncbi:MAG: TlpA family protein disulfide reductase [Acidimicrobiia bacterium]|nr:TlpA family protein disulfide reductase [Acidimicrobiia bacterium]